MKQTLPFLLMLLGTIVPQKTYINELIISNHGLDPISSLLPVIPDQPYKLKRNEARG